MTATRVDKGTVRQVIGEGGARFGLVMALLMIVAVFSAIKPSTYFTSLNFETIATNQAPTLLLALAVLLPLIAGEFDLSVASNFGFCQLLVAGLIIKSGMSWPLAIVVTLGVGALVGLCNGLLITLLRINSFIATLGMATILDGVTTQYSGGQIIEGNFPNGFLKIGSIQVLGSLSIFVVYAVAVALILWIALTYLPSGRHLYATGGARNAARLLGLRTNYLIVGSFVLCGFIAAITGIVTASQLTSGQPSLGASYLLPAYAGAFLGATTVNPGQFNVWGTVIGAFLLGAGVTGLQQIGIASYVQDYFNGGALLIAVAASVYVTRRRGGSTPVRIGGLRRDKPSAPVPPQDGQGAPPVDSRPEAKAPAR
jgi:ribose transport system permease protein